MRHLLFIAIMVISANFAAFGQTSKTPGPPVKAVAAKPPPDTFPREKFDPKRDPAPDLARAIEIASKTGKRIILDVGGEWCHWCVYMDKFFSENADLAKLRDDNYIWVKINFSEENENKPFLAAYPEPAGFPHLYVLDAAGKLLRSQDTSPLEAGSGYDLAKFTEFLKTWAPAVTDNAGDRAKP